MTERPRSADINQRVYETIKHQIVCCQFQPGARLKIEFVAEQLRVSPTPVREVFNHLVAENLIVKIPKMGFFMKTLSVQDIRDLYEMSRLLIEWSLRRRGSRALPCSLDAQTDGNGLDPVKSVSGGEAKHAVEQLAFMFVEFARLSNNDEVATRVININERLHYFRVLECSVFTDVVHEIDQMLALSRQREDESLCRTVVAYHDARIDQVSAVLRATRSSAPNEWRPLK